MKVVVSNPENANIFCNLFGPIKQFNECLQLYIKPDEIYVQGMDQGHVLLYEFTLKKEWFDEYEVDKEYTIGINATMFAKVLDVRDNNNSINITYDGGDKLRIEFKGAKINKKIDIALVDISSELLTIPEFESHSIFSMQTKIFAGIIEELNIFNESAIFNCTEDNIKLLATGLDGNMDINIPIDYLEEFAIDEDTTVSVNFGLNYIKKICSFQKLSSIITVEVSNNYPMKVIYELGDDSTAIFYLAPKIDDDDE